MKSKKIYIDSTYRKKYIALDYVCEAYESGKFKSINCPKYIPNGFFCKTLTLDQWLVHYNIGIW